MIEDKLLEVWGQKKFPVLFLTKKPAKLLVRIPGDLSSFTIRHLNQRLIESGHIRSVTWSDRFRCWKVPKAWHEELLKKLVSKYVCAFLIQPYKKNQKCAPSCWNAQGTECECSCLGENHGLGKPEGNWFVINDTLAVKYNQKEYYIQLITTNQEVTP